MRRMIWVVAALVALQLGCDKRDTLQAPAEPPPADEPRDDGKKDGDLTTTFHESTSRYAQEAVSRLTMQPTVSRYIDTFEDAGYELAPQYSFVVDGTRTSDGRSVEVTILSMASTRAPGRDAIYIFHVRDGRRELVVPARLSFEDGGFGDTRLSDGVWLGPVRPVEYGADGTDASAAVFSWRQYFECIGTATSSALIACTLTCRWLPHVYVQCVTICMGQAALSAIIGCVFFQVA